MEVSACACVTLCANDSFVVVESACFLCRG